MPTKITSKALAQQLVDKYTTFLFDCDGVLWSGSHLLPESKDTIALLRKHNKQLIFVTNNSTKSRRAYAEKFQGFGIDVKPEEVFCSAYSAAVYLKQVRKLETSKKVLVVGERGLEEELQAMGYTTVGGTDPKFNEKMDEADITRDESIGCVLAGLDTKINYNKLAYAQAQLLKHPDTIFLATNIDSTFPSHGRLLPGAGTVIQAVATCSGRQPEAALGKPSANMMDCIKANYHLDPERTVMVGDRLNTDMEFGKSGGLGTFFVLSGVDSEEAMLESGVPDWYAENLGAVFRYIEQ